LKNIKRRIKIAGCGAYLPEKIVTNDELEIRLGVAPGSIEKRTGIVERRDAQNETPISMMRKSADDALAHSGYGIEDIDAIITTCVLPHSIVPCNAVSLHATYGEKARGKMAFDINTTCLSFLVAMNQASLMIQSGQVKRVLIATADVPFSSGCLVPGDFSTISIMGDASAAMVLEACEEGSQFNDFHFSTYSEYKDLVRVSLGVRNKPGLDVGVSEITPWQFRMDGKEVFRAGLSVGAELYRTLFSQEQIDELDVVIPHQTNEHGVQVYRRLGFGDKVYSNVKYVGNTVSAALPLALVSAVKEGKVKRGDKVALIGTAAGLSVGVLKLVF